MDEGYQSHAECNTATPGVDLSEEHRRMLEGESGIATEIVGGRGYRTVSRADVPDDFAGYQRRNGLLMPLYSPDGVTTGYQLRADRPRRDKRRRPIRYETPTGGRIIADVHPRMLGAAQDRSRPLWITEGVKKGDALASRGRCAISLVGVWMFRPKSSGDMLPCFNHVALRGRRVFVVFDSDVMRKPEVAMALERLVGDLEARGARPLVVYLDDAPDGAKVGIDDHLAAGGTVEHLEEIAQPFEPTHYTKTRLSKDAQLAASVAALWRWWHAHSWRGMGGYTRRQIMRVLIDEAVSCGTPTDRGVGGIALGQRAIAERAGTRQATVARQLRKLEELGYIQREPHRASQDAPVSYLLPVDVPRAYQEGKTGGREGQHQGQNKARVCRGYDRDDTPLAHGSAHASDLSELGRLRWAFVRRVWSEQGYIHEYVERLGPIRGHALECLLEAGGRLELGELIAGMNRSDRPCRFRERHISKLESAELVRMEGSTVLLTEDWREKLLIARELGDEYEAEGLARKRHRRQREAWRKRNEPPTSNPTPAGEAALRRSHEKRGAEMMKDAGSVDDLERVPDPDPEIVDALRRALVRWPDHRDDYASWWASTLHVEGWLACRPDPEAVEVALYEIKLGRAAA